MRRVERVIVPCHICASDVSRRARLLSKRAHHFCSPACYAEHLRRLPKENHGSWRGGRIGHVGGYIRIKIGTEHPMADAQGYVLEHRLVMANHLGRPLLDEEVVHHVNHVRTDNRIENLHLYESNSAHRRAHALEDLASRQVS